jgi:WD40 repeat protein/Tfp pilus assembly protein PilF
LRVFDVGTGQLLVELTHPAPVACPAAWRPDGRVLIVAGTDNRLYTWDVDREEQLNLIVLADAGAPTTLAFHPGGELLVSTSTSRNLHVRHAATGRDWLRLPARLGSLVRFRQDGLRLAGHIGTGQRLYEVAEGREYRTLSRDGGPGKVYAQPAVSPDGRLVAVPVGQGVRLWDLPAGREGAVLPTGPGSGWARFEPNGGLLTSSKAGLHRWPVKSGAALLRVGPPQRVPFTGACRAANRDGRVLIDPNLTIWRDDRAGKTLGIDPRQVGVVAVSPDGRLIATIVSAAHRLTVWDAHTAERVKMLPLEQGAAMTRGVGFSPDGHWLAGTGTRARLWQVGTWREVSLPMGTRFSFAPDSRLLALEQAPGVLVLVEAASGRTVARLEAPDQDRARFTFNHDGTQLLAASDERLPVVHVWDLVRVRKGLKEMGLDWNWPELRPRPPADRRRRVVVDPGALAPSFAERQGEPPRRTVERASAALKINPEDVEAYHQRAHAYQTLGQHARSVADFTQALKRQPANVHFLICRGGDRLHVLDYEGTLADMSKALILKPTPEETASACNAMAWVHVAGPRELRDVRKALALSERALQLLPEMGTYHTTRALVDYRLGRLDGARQRAQRAIARKGEASAFELYPLALIHQKQGETAKAKDAFTRADAWRRIAGRGQTPHQKAVLDTLRAEAEAELAKRTPP